MGTIPTQVDLQTDCYCASDKEIKDAMGTQSKRGQNHPERNEESLTQQRVIPVRGYKVLDPRSNNKGTLSHRPKEGNPRQSLRKH